MKRKAFTLTELLIGMLIMVITAGVFTLNSNMIGRHTAKREAERVAAYIQTHFRKADITQNVLWITITSEEIEIKAGEFYDYLAYTNAKSVDEPLHASTGCTFPDNLRLVYPATKDRKQGAITFKPVSSGASVNIGTDTEGQYCLTVNGADGETYNVLIGSQL